MEKVQEPLVVEGSASAKEETKPTISEARKMLVVAHRLGLKEALDKKMDPGGARRKATSNNNDANKEIIVRNVHYKNIRLTWLKFLTVSSQPLFYYKHCVELMVIDDPDYSVKNVVTLIAEDKNKDVIRVQIFNYDASKDVPKKYVFGLRFYMLNPIVVKLCDTNESTDFVLRNYDWRLIVQLGKLEKACHACFKENATKGCSKCKRLYCSRECQLLDWKELHHKLICPVEYIDSAASADDL